jgi:prevent-host-death family protein
MKEIAISEFRAKCSAILEQVRTRPPILVMRLGKPLAQIVPPSPAKGTGSGDWNPWLALCAS